MLLNTFDLCYQGCMSEHGKGQEKIGNFEQQLQPLKEAGTRTKQTNSNVEKYQ